MVWAVKTSKEKFVMLGVDFMALNLAYLASYLLRFHSGIFRELVAPQFRQLIQPSLLISTGWISIFLFFGMYRSLALKNLEEILFGPAKASLVGVLTIFLITLDPHQPISVGRLVLLLYWGMLIFFVTFGRLLVRRHYYRRALEGNILLETRIEVFPDMVKTDHNSGSRLANSILSLAVFVLGLPLWMLVTLLIRLDRTGPTFYSKQK
jgi:hypothetical protein